MALHAHGAGEQVGGGTRDGGELSVVAGLAGEAGEVHGEERAVGEQDRSPEVDFAQAFRKAAVEQDRRPVVQAAEETRRRRPWP